MTHEIVDNCSLNDDEVPEEFLCNQLQTANINFIIDSGEIFNILAYLRLTNFLFGKRIIVEDLLLPLHWDELIRIFYRTSLLRDEISTIKKNENGLICITTKRFCSLPVKLKNFWLRLGKSSSA